MKPAGGRYEVAVIGGGSAGLAAAITSAREGARTLLIERHGFLGGMGTASLVHTFCGLYLLRDEPGAVLANEGFPAEMAERMIAATGIGPVRMGRVDVLPQHPVEFVRIADELVSAEPMLELLLHTEVGGISCEADGWLIQLEVLGRKIASDIMRWLAGRCISTDHDAQASVRVMGTCFATGEAAGRAAAHDC